MKAAATSAHAATATQIMNRARGSMKVKPSTNPAVARTTGIRGEDEVPGAVQHGDRGGAHQDPVRRPEGGGVETGYRRAFRAVSVLDHRGPPGRGGRLVLALATVFEAWSAGSAAAATKSSSSVPVVWGSSIIAVCPTPGSISTRAPGTAL